MRAPLAAPVWSPRTFLSLLPDACLAPPLQSPSCSPPAYPPLYPNFKYADMSIALQYHANASDAHPRSF